MKKIIRILSVALLVLMLLPASVLADGGESDLSVSTTVFEDEPAEEGTPAETDDADKAEPTETTQKKNDPNRGKKPSSSNEKKTPSFLDKIAEMLTSQKYWDKILLGLRMTLIISVGAIALGLLLGTIVALVTIAKPSKLLTVPKLICKAYLMVIRGTPMALQLFIWAYVILAIKNFPLELTAIIAFGINSGAYVAENIRAGVLSVDIGQTEAGRALGLPGRITMTNIVIPQAIKNVIPAIGNELIALIKETSIVSMIGMYDLTMAAKDIGSGNNLASYIVPMTVVAVFYLVIVYILTFCIKLIEKRLRASDKR